MPQQTPLFTAHQELGARIIDFNGWEMPVQYPAGIIAEHRTVREKCGIFDTCHMGEFYLDAPEVRPVLNRLLAGDFTNLKNGRMRYSFITNAAGGVVDDVVVFMLNDRRAMICVNAGDIPGDFAALLAHMPADAVLSNESAALAKIDIQGAEAASIVQILCGIDFRELPFYGFYETTWQGKAVIISRSGYTGSPGVEIFIAADEVRNLWDEAIAVGALPCGLGARDTLRLEAGLPLYGHELNPEIDPLMAGFAKFVVLDKPEDFCGKAALQKIAADRAAGTSGRILRGLRIADKRIPRAHSPLLDAEGTEIGVITSGAPAPTAGGNIAFAYVDAVCGEYGRELQINVRGHFITATVAETPFYRCPELRVRR